MHLDATDRGSGELHVDIFGNRQVANDPQLKGRPGSLHPLEVLAVVAESADQERKTSGGGANHLAVLLQLVMDRNPDELGAVGVEPLLDQELDQTQIHGIDIDRELLHLGHLAPPASPSNWMVMRMHHPCGWRQESSAGRSEGQHGCSLAENSHFPGYQWSRDDGSGRSDEVGWRDAARRRGRLAGRDYFSKICSTGTIFTASGWILRVVIVLSCSRT